MQQGNTTGTRAIFPAYTEFFICRVSTQQTWTPGGSPKDVYESADVGFYVNTTPINTTRVWGNLAAPTKVVISVIDPSANNQFPIPTMYYALYHQVITANSLLYTSDPITFSVYDCSTPFTTELNVLPP